MKNSTSVLTILLVSVFCQLYAQDFEIIVKNSSSTQDFLYPERPEEGIFAGNNIHTIGIGFGVREFEKKIFKWNGHTKFRGSYIQKGFRIPHQISGLVNEQLEIWAIDNYHFFSLDVIPTLNFGKKAFGPYLLAGVRGDLLLHNTSENYQEFYTMFNGYPADLRNHRRLTSGFLLGMGFEWYEMLMVEFEFNQDFNFSPILRRSDFIGRNVLFSLNLIANISQIKRVANRT